MLLELLLQQGGGGLDIAGGNSAAQARRERDGRALLAHARFHGARQLLIQAERAVEVCANFGHEVAGAGFAHVFVAEPDRHQHRDQRRDHDGEREPHLNAAGALHACTRSQRVSTRHGSKPR
jgi:hypothetical protein